MDIVDALKAEFLALVTQGDGCWTWGASHYASGYAMFKQGYAHRYSYELFVGPIPQGHQVDHICMNRGCLNPQHLRPATNKQNNEHHGLRGDSTSGHRGVSLHKPSGLFMAHVTHNGKRTYLGYFRDAAEAGEAARKARLELFTHNDLDARAAVTRGAR